MTLIAAMKYRNQGIVISDFRITNEVTGVQQDIGLKYIGFDNRLILYMAGKPTFLLPKLEEILPTIKNQLNFENVDQAEGPLKSVLETIMSGLDRNFESSIIGVFLNNPTNEFKMFRMDLLYRDNDWEVIVLPDQDFTWQVIGTGEIIMQPDFFPSWRPFSLHEVFCKGLRTRDGEEETYSIETVAESIKDSIRRRLLSLGGSVFKKLGISPEMNISIVEGSYLSVIAREYENTSYFIDREMKVTKHAIQRAPGDSAKLVDQENKEIRAYQTNSDFPGTTTVPIIFDPLGVEGEDTRHYPYTLMQEMISEPGEPFRIARCVRYTEIREWAGEIFGIRRQIKYQEKLIDYMMSPVSETNLNVNPFDFTQGEELYWAQVDLFDPQWIEQKYGTQGPFQLQIEEQNDKGS